MYVYVYVYVHVLCVTLPSILILTMGHDSISV